MENLSLEVAYARYGAQALNKQRSLSALATDGSLVLSCHSDQFSRPGIGVLRYSAQLTQMTGGKASIAELRAQLRTVCDAGSAVRPVVITPPRGLIKRIIHVRSDLVGKVVEFDGDSFVVDFTRTVAPAEEPKARRKR